MKIKCLTLILCLFVFIGSADAGSYQDALSEWKSYEDVASWLKTNFKFDKSRQIKIVKLLMKEGPSGAVYRNATAFYEKNSKGYCADSANFAIKSLNRVDPSYNARWVFIWNKKGRPNHWVAAFDLNEKLYIMDYGTGRKFKKMQGVHGPYNSLDDYKDYLTSLNISGFEVGTISFMDMPGKEE